MSRITRHRDAPYWQHSDPNPPAGDVAAQPVILPTVKGLRDLAKHACPGGCNKAWRDRAWSDAAIAELEGSLSENRAPAERIVIRGVPKPAEPIWCRACAENIRVGTGRLPDLAAACGARRDGQLAPPPKAERHGSVIAPPSPSPGWDQVEDIVTWAATWMETVDDYVTNRGREYVIEFDVDPERPDPSLLGWKVYTTMRDAMAAAAVAQAKLAEAQRQAVTLTRSTRYLVGHMTPVLSAPFAHDYGVELFDLVHRSEMVSGTDELVHPLPLTCLQCDRKALIRYDGQDRIRCRACKASWTQAAYDRLAVAFRHDQERRRG